MAEPDRREDKSDGPSFPYNIFQCLIERNDLLSDDVQGSFTSRIELGSRLDAFE
jgi:hypothetical protein